MSGAKVTESGGSVPKYGREHQKAIRGSRKGPNFASPPYKAPVITRQELIHTQSTGTQQLWRRKNANLTKMTTFEPLSVMRRKISVSYQVIYMAKH